MTAKSIATLLLLWLASLCNVPLSAAQINVAVVVNSGNAASTLSLGDLRKIFSGEKHSWPGGQPVKPGVFLSGDRKSTRLNSSHQIISYAVFCLKKKKHILIGRA